MAIEYERHLWSADDYEAMIAAGILDEDDHVELLGGEIVEMTAQGPPHSFTTAELVWMMHSRLGEDAVIHAHSPVRIDHRSVPEPDVAVLRPPRRRYRRERPRAEDLLLVIEVADSTLRRDRLWKMPFYARAGIPETWLVDVNGEQIERYTQPTPDGYAQVELFGRGASLTVPGFPETPFTINEILGEDEH